MKRRIIGWTCPKCFTEFKLNYKKNHCVYCAIDGEIVTLTPIYHYEIDGENIILKYQKFKGEDADKIYKCYRKEE